jgi:protease-4
LVSQSATVPPQKSRFILRLLFVLLLLGLVGSLALNGVLMALVGLTGLGSSDGEGRVREQFYSHNHWGTEKVAILSIEGTILSGDGFFKQQIDHARKDAESGSLKAIVVRVNSPGGTISGSDYMLHHLRKLAADTHLPVVVSMGGLAASGGYYVSMCTGDQPNTIFAEPTTWTGSIGVVIPHYNLAELLEKWGVQEDAVASNPLKTMGTFARKMTDRERKIFQELVDEGFTQFKAVIKEGRANFRKDPSSLDKLATGQVFTAQQALKNGLIDKIGFVEDAIDRAIRLAKLDRANVKVVKYKAEPKLSEILLGRSRIQPAVDLAALLDSMAPGAYYLCTWIPPLASSEKSN